MINIATWIRECDEPAFARMFGVYPDCRLWNARTEAIPWPEISALLLTGGSDISAEFLRQPIPNPALIQDADPARDQWEFPALEKALAQRWPLLAICRGLQVLNVGLGGTLTLDIPNHDGLKFQNVQPLTCEAATPLRFEQVNSSHHQALDRLGAGLKVTARCTDDGVIEQAEIEGHPFAVAAQYHPERDELYRPLFDAFWKACTSSSSCSGGL